MSRKKIVIIEWIVLFLVLTDVAVFCIHGIISRKAAREEGKRAAEAETRTEQEAVLNAEAEQETVAYAEAEQEAVAYAEAEQKAVINTETETEAAADADTEQEVPADTPEQQDSTSARTYTLSFAGDCTIGSLVEWQGEEPGDFQSVVGTDFAYPLSHVRQIFSADDLTVVNLEGTFTTSWDAVDKPYRFKADPSYVQVLTEGSVEAVSASNNHTYDFLEEGFADTLETLDQAGIRHTSSGAPLIQELPGGLLLGIVSYNTVENWEGEEVWRDSVYTDIAACREAGCDLIIGFMHWGTVEYLTEPEEWEVAFAHDMADWGCDLIVGGHAHILQRMEYYHDVPIFYSMGNFCYGGHLNPGDKDSVIVQAQFTWNPVSRKASRSGLFVIPCLISSQEDANNYCPTPCEEGSEDYLRIMERLEI